MVSMIESNPGYDEKKIKAHLQYVKGKAAKKSPSKDDEEMGENDDIAVIKREPLTQSNEAISSDEEASLDSREVGSTVWAEFQDKKLFHGASYWIQGTIMPQLNPESPFLTVLFTDDDILDKPPEELRSRPPSGALIHEPSELPLSFSIF